MPLHVSRQHLQWGLQCCVRLSGTHSAFTCALAPANVLGQENQVTIRIRIWTVCVYCKRRTSYLQRSASWKMGQPNLSVAN